MSEDILINVAPQETRVAVMQQGVVQDMPEIETIDALHLPGAILRGYLGLAPDDIPPGLPVKRPSDELGVRIGSALESGDTAKHPHLLQAAPACT